MLNDMKQDTSTGSPKCPKCGLAYVNKHGWVVDRDGKHRRYKCQGCAHVFKGAETFGGREAPDPERFGGRKD